MKIDLNKTTYQEDVEFKHKKLEAGLFGKLFGTGSNASINIAGIILIGLLISMLIVWSVDAEGSSVFLKTASPIMTLALGYLFGKQS